MKKYISNARLISLGLTVALLPFSMQLCNVALFIFIFTCLIEGDFEIRTKEIASNPITWILPLFFLLHVIGVFYSGNSSSGWSNAEKKLAFLFVPLLVGSAKPFEKEELRKVMWIFVSACVLGTLVCIINIHPNASDFWSSISYIHLAEGIGIHPTYLSLYLLICILIILNTMKKTWITTALVIYLLIFIVFLSSRIILLATLITLIAAAPKRKLLFAGVGVILIATFLNPLSRYRNLQEYTASNFAIPPATMSDNPISIRVSLLWLSVKAMADVNPVIGNGTGAVEQTISALADEFNVHNILNTSDPHNQYIHTYIALGAPGLFLLVAAFIVPLLIFFQKREFWLCAGLLIFMSVCFTESVLERQKGIVLFSLFIGLSGNHIREWRPAAIYQRR